MTVEQITYEQTKPFILGIHYARRMPCVQYAFGLFDDGVLIGVVTYGQHERYVVSYADVGGWGHVGYVYQATNWLYTGLTKPRTDKYSESGHSRHYAKDETRRQYRTAKHRYIYLVGDRRTKRNMMKQLKYKIIDEYPKGDTRHYDTSNPLPFCEYLGKTL